MHLVLLFLYIPSSKTSFSGVLRKAEYTCYTLLRRPEANFFLGRARRRIKYIGQLVTDGCQRMFCAARRRLLRRCEINSASRCVKKEGYTCFPRGRQTHGSILVWKNSLKRRFTLARVWHVRNKNSCERVIKRDVKIWSFIFLEVLDQGTHCAHPYKREALCTCFQVIL